MAAKLPIFDILAEKKQRLINPMNHSEREEFDKNHIWHPYTSMTKPIPCYQVESAEGVRLYLDNGKSLIDGMSSWWCVIHGYNNKALNDAIKDQIKKVSHVMFGGIIHEPAIQLCKHLVEMTHPKLECVFLCDSGSVAVEVALKQAIQYWISKGQVRKKKFMSIANGYHGDTFGAMFVSDPNTSMHSIYNGYGPDNIFANAPQVGFDEEWDNEDIHDFEEKIEKRHDEIAAVILEPILQGAGGMRMYHPQFLKFVRELCNKHKVLLIADEIATGFGRTGKLFACEHAQICPDIMCVGKAMTGGYMTMAATISTRNVAEVISDGPTGCFMHGPTFMANPLACAVSTRNLEILKTGNWKQQVAGIEEILKKKLLPLKMKRNNKIKDVRVLGAVGVIEMVSAVDIAVIQKKFVELGVWIRPFGKLIYIMPPYVIIQEDLEYLVDVMIKVALE